MKNLRLTPDAAVGTPESCPVGGTEVGRSIDQSEGTSTVPLKKLQARVTPLASYWQTALGYVTSGALKAWSRASPAKILIGEAHN